MCLHSKQRLNVCQQIRFIQTVDNAPNILNKYSPRVIKKQGALKRGSLNEILKGEERLHRAFKQPVAGRINIIIKDN